MIRLVYYLQLQAAIFVVSVAQLTHQALLIVARSAKKALSLTLKEPFSPLRHGEVFLTSLVMATTFGVVVQSFISALFQSVALIVIIAANL